MGETNSFRILHIMRTPVGGLFRHVLDLAREQAARGHAVGVIADSSTGGAGANSALSALEPALRLGLSRVPMSRQLGPLDVTALNHVTRRARESGANVLHGHGAKGGAYARLARHVALRVYTPHGGSLFFSPTSPAGIAYLTLERLLRSRTDLALFESAFAEETFRRHIGAPPFARVVHNGISSADLAPVTPDDDAADFIFIGELRWRKGVDVVIDALARLSADGWNGKAVLYGEGPDRATFEKRVADRGLAHQVHFAGSANARAAFRTGRLLLVPSRAESFPYIVLEAVGARMPILTTSVGGIPEIFGPDAGALLPPGDVDALVAAIRRSSRHDGTALIERLHARIAQNFTLDRMTDAVLASYASAMAAKRNRSAPSKG